MSERTPDIQPLVDDLKRLRDEIRVHLHLAKLDAKEEWEHLERQWTDFEHKAKNVRHDLRITADDVGAALRLAGEELRQGYERVRRSL